jgi:hypothetical protein
MPLSVKARESQQHLQSCLDDLSLLLLLAKDCRSINLGIPGKSQSPSLAYRLTGSFPECLPD